MGVLCFLTIEERLISAREFEVAEEIDMKYVKVTWQHKFKDEPIYIYSELNECRDELRKLEVFPSGKIGVASADQSTLSTQLSEPPYPSLEEIGEDPQFIPEEITKVTFESLWELAMLRDA